MPVEVIILAAGQGTRMKSSLPKVLHPLAGRPMLQHVIESAQQLQPSICHVVYGHGGEQVQAQLTQTGVSWVEQREQLGTGHAVLQAMPGVADDATVLILYGDVPLIRPETLEALLREAARGPALLTARVANPAGYGRILRDDSGQLLGVIEDKDASPAQKLIDEINTGMLAAPALLLKQWLPQVGNANSQGEYYLPDILPMAVAAGIGVSTSSVGSEIEILGVNDRVQLNRVEREYQSRQAEKLMHAGVTLADAARIDVRGKLECEPDVFIDVNAVLVGNVSLGRGVRVGANCVLINTTVEAGVEILPFSHFEEAQVAADCTIGPFARLRPGSQLGVGAKIGNFVETKNSRIGVGSKVNHLTYIGDTEMGAGVNIGAGTIVCNYDGASKHKTTIGDGVFVGSNSTLVAPLEIEKDGFVGAGSTVTKKVEHKQLAISRAKQRNLDGWQRPVKVKE